MATAKKTVLVCRWGSIMALLAVAVLVIFQPAAAETVAGSRYTLAVQPLTLEECGRCHSAHYSWLKENGARHQTVACTECHEVFHAYNPLRNNYAEIMPKCSSCHDAPHGSAEPLMDCLECHSNPHQPLVSIPAPAALEGRCPLCHVQIAARLQAEVSKHTEQECSSCHSEKHGRIPGCADCHGNHSPLADLAPSDCMACHPVHTPLAISYSSAVAAEVCAGCHDEAYKLLQQKLTKHSVLTCAACHSDHGLLPDCRNCHGEPHSAIIHEKYEVCGDCHGLAHNIQK